MRKAPRLTPEFLKQLRTRRVAVVHPNDADGAVLTQQLQRIGCQVQTFWPAPPELPENIDIVFCAVQPSPHARGNHADLTRRCESAAIIAVIGYENPTVFDEMLQLGASGVLTSPVRSTGVLAALVMTLGVNEELQGLRKRVARLEQKLAGVQQVHDAKAIIMRTRGVSDAEAYRVMREQAMSKRVAVEEIARAIIHADAILSG
ncbi:MAG: ANTAR domain-containing protein [Rubrivivax sp.]|nr:MAG: ANTAR domain-containing protein [Rubrivivax sp.]